MSERIKTTINDIQKYIKWINDICDTKNSITDDKFLTIHRPSVDFYYRGQASTNWELKASIIREKDVNSKYEGNILRSSELKLWNELSMFNTYLEKLVYLQHYGMKTRLVDVTSNPLVALYFACLESEEKDDGVVYAGYSYKSHYEIAELTAEYLFTKSLDNKELEEDILEYSKEKGVDVKDFEEAHFFNPPINNTRVDSQKGAFILSPLIKKGKNDEIVLNKDSLENTNAFLKKKAVIPSNKKERILKELSKLGIDRGTIYQGVSDKIYAIMQEEKWKLKDIPILSIKDRNGHPILDDAHKSLEKKQRTRHNEITN